VPSELPLAVRPAAFPTLPTELGALIPTELSALIPTQLPPFFRIPTELPSIPSELLPLIPTELPPTNLLLALLPPDLLNLLPPDIDLLPPAINLPDILPALVGIIPTLLAEIGLPGPGAPPMAVISILLGLVPPQLIDILKRLLFGPVREHSTVGATCPALSHFAARQEPVSRGRTD
jgi:hypothetical protein